MKKRLFIISAILLMILGIKVVNADDSTWQNDWTFTTNNTAKTITLTKYKGTQETIVIPSKATIGDTEYSVIVGNGSNSSTRPFVNSNLKNVSFEQGVKINNLNYLFYQATNLESVDLTGVDTSSATTLQGMFYGATNIKKVVLSGLDLSNVTNVRYLFYQASNIEEIDLSNTNMSKITTFAYANPTNNFAASPFYAMYKLKKINMNNLNTSGLTTAQRMFTIDANNSGNRNYLESIDLTNWNISNVTSFNETFKHCGENNEVVIKGLDTLDTSKITDFAGTFQSTYNLKDLTGVKEWDTSSAVYMYNMFSEAKSITELDLSGWDTSNVTSISSMFSSCHALKDLNVSTWNTKKVTTMEAVFKSCTSLEVLDLSNWTTESIEGKSGSHMWEMFGPQRINSEYPMTPLKEITLNKDFMFDTWQPPSLRSGYWHLKEGTEEETTPRFTPARLYTAYNNHVTPPDGYAHTHTYVLTELDPASAEYYAHGWGDNNVWEVHYPTDKFKGYCINLHRGAPHGYYDRTKVKDNSIIDQGFLDSNNYGYAPLGSTMEEALMTLIYYGYGNNGAGIQEKYNLDDHTFMMITQQAIWDYTDRYNNIQPRDENTNAGKAYYELVSKRFSDIPNNENLKLYLYESIDGMQNLLSISGLSDVAHAGVRVLKLSNATDGSLEPLPGAEFTIYNDENDEVATIISDQDGYATKYNTDSIYGLPEGIYTIRETKAPRGYIKTSNYYTFIVRPEDDNEIILIGKEKGSGDEVAMIFENTTDPNIEGGGLIIKIVDEKGNPILSGAKFAIVNEGGTVMEEITTGAGGEYRTGRKSLLLNKNYTARLTEPPKGYITTVERQNETLTRNGEYETLIFKFIPKTCKVQIKGEKKYNTTFKGNDFAFELKDQNGNLIQRAFNDSKGNINFNIDYTAADLGFKIYTLSEIKGTDSNIIYDNHIENIIVNIDDNGADNLNCNVEYDEDNVKFTNEYNCKDCNPPQEPENKPVPSNPPETNDYIKKYMAYLLISMSVINTFVYYAIKKKFY